MRAILISASLTLTLAPIAGAQEREVPNCVTTRAEVEQLWCQGGEAFVRQTSQGFAASITPYRRALQLEKKHRVLSHDAWLVLVDNLGMAYGVTGEIDEAREVLEYGIAQEPGYPLFYYEMACVYAETGDRAMVLEYLRRAFERRANVIPGVAMPDPESDDSFQKFMDDPAFVAALRNLPGRGR
jgi:tetratricopeptide (TPR) repeat protein